MNFFEKLKTIFSKKEKEASIKLEYQDLSFHEKSRRTTDLWCNDSRGVLYLCDKCGNRDSCQWLVDAPVFNSKLPSIMLIDDNPGIISFLKDDLEDIFEEHGKSLSDYNILDFTTKFAAYKFLAMNKRFGGLNIQYAIIDITLGGSAETVNGNIRLTGVDVFREMYMANPNLNYVFYTGNQLNSYIKSNKDLIEEYNRITGDTIFNHVLYKTSVGMDARRAYFAKILFNWGE